MQGATPFSLAHIPQIHEQETSTLPWKWSARGFHPDGRTVGTRTVELTKGMAITRRLGDRVPKGAAAIKLGAQTRQWLTEKVA